MNIGGKYGFNDMYSGLFKDHPRDSIVEIIDIENPETSSYEERAQKRLSQGELLFDENHYM